MVFFLYRPINFIKVIVVFQYVASVKLDKLPLLFGEPAVA